VCGWSPLQCRRHDTEPPPNDKSRCASNALGFHPIQVLAGQSRCGCFRVVSLHTCQSNPRLIPAL